jgi:hypothetical protein
MSYKTNIYYIYSHHWTFVYQHCSIKVKIRRTPLILLHAAHIWRLDNRLEAPAHVLQRNICLFMLLLHDARQSCQRSVCRPEFGQTHARRQWQDLFRHFPQFLQAETGVITSEMSHPLRYSDWLRAERPRIRSSNPNRVKNCHFSVSSRPALGPTQPPIQWVPGAFSPGVKRQGREADQSSFFNNHRFKNQINISSIFL